MVKFCYNLIAGCLTSLLLLLISSSVIEFLIQDDIYIIQKIFLFFVVFIYSFGQNLNLERYFLGKSDQLFGQPYQYFGKQYADGSFEEIGRVYKTVGVVPTLIHIIFFFFIFSLLIDLILWVRVFSTFSIGYLLIFKGLGKGITMVDFFIGNNWAYLKIPVYIQVFIFLVWYVVPSKYLDSECG